MRRSNAALLASALVPLALVFPLPAEALSLKEALATAYATNPQIESARANLRPQRSYAPRSLRMRTR